MLGIAGMCLGMPITVIAAVSLGDSPINKLSNRDRNLLMNRSVTGAE